MSMPQFRIASTGKDFVVLPTVYLGLAVLVNRWLEDVETRILRAGKAPHPSDRKLLLFRIRNKKIILSLGGGAGLKFAL